MAHASGAKQLTELGFAIEEACKRACNRTAKHGATFGNAFTHSKKTVGKPARVPPKWHTEPAETALSGDVTAHLVTTQPVPASGETAVRKIVPAVFRRHLENEIKKEL